MELRFVRSESTFDYFAATDDYLRHHGKPVAFYSDKASVFRVNTKSPKADNLVLHYKRVMYIVDPSPASESARGTQVLVIEADDGGVRLEYRGDELTTHAFAKDARVTQAAFVENKRLSTALLAIQVKQRERDQKTLDSGRPKPRDEDHLRKALGEAGQPDRRRRSARIAASAPAVVPVNPLLEGAMNWAKGFAAKPR
jgi:hypothetical protein